MRKRLYLIKIFLFIFILQSHHFLYSQISTRQENVYKNGVVSSANEIASEVGVKIMQNGGNAIDAVVGTAFALAVVYPQAGNIGGGGFFVARLADGTEVSVDFRETAPMKSFRDMYLDSLGNVIPDLSTNGHLASGVPGSVAGLLYILEKYGTKTRAEVMSYAINLAENGFHINSELANALNEYQGDFLRYPGSGNIFGKRFSSGDFLVQTELANTLKSISEKGRDGFYTGWVADKIILEMNRGDGIITYDDLKNYKCKDRNVIKGTYRGYDLITMGPPSSGGICLLYLLNIIEKYDLLNLGFTNENYINLLAEAMKLVYADRSEFMGDMDFVKVPVSTLISKEYANDRMKYFQFGVSRNSSDVKPGNIFHESNQTTHISTADSKGNLVSLTTTLNDVFGSKVVVEGAGFLLNNEMDDFSVKPGVPNIFGLIGSSANAIEPGKRMLSSMTPVIITKNGKPFLVIGSPGGGKIITSVFQSILNIIDFNMELETAIDAPRIHHQWLPDVLQLESKRLTKKTIKKLSDIGYTVKPVHDFGRVEGIIFDADGNMKGHSDRRGYGKAVGF
jgi:gamma-glutamyltranspeptidase / glutathione hydrolase